MSRLRHKRTSLQDTYASDGATETGGNPAVYSLAKEKHSIGTIGGAKSKPRMDRKKRGGKAGMPPMTADTGSLSPEHVAAIHGAVRHMLHNAPPEVAPIMHQAIAAHQLDRDMSGSNSDME
jgi:hypothetical protein